MLIPFRMVSVILVLSVVLGLTQSTFFCEKQSEQEQSHVNPFQLTFAPQFTKHNAHQLEKIATAFASFQTQCDRLLHSDFSTIQESLKTLWQTDQRNNVFQTLAILQSMDSTNERVNTLFLEYLVTEAKRLASNPTWANLHQAIQYLAQAQAFNANDDQLQQLLEDYLEQMYPDWYPTKYWQALAAINEGLNFWDRERFPDAIISFRTAYETMPVLPDALLHLGNHYRDTDRMHQAVVYYEILMDQYESHPYGKFVASITRSATEQTAQMATRDLDAEAHLKLIQLDLYNGKVGSIQGELGRWEHAGEMNFLMYYLLGRSYNRDAVYHTAQNYFEKAIEEIKEVVPHSDSFHWFIYKTQLEDQLSFEVIARRFRTTKELIEACNPYTHTAYAEDYTMLIIPKPKQNDTYQFPWSGYLSSLYGYRVHPIDGTWKMHYGIDIEADGYGHYAIAIADGKVESIRVHERGGNILTITHPNNMQSRYLHTQNILVEEGEQIEQGQPVAEIGQTGSALSIHLHFGLSKQDQTVDPMDYF